MDTRLLVGAVCIAMGIVSIAICYLGTRNPRQPKWACEAIMANFIVPVVVGCLAIGPMLIGEYVIVHRSDLKVIDLLTALSIITASIIFVKMLRIGKRVAAYEQNGPSSRNDRFTTPQGGKMGMTAA